MLRRRSGLPLPRTPWAAARYCAGVLPDGLGRGRVRILAEAPGTGPGNWAGAPSGAFSPEGALYVAYRVRSPGRRGAEVLIARLERDDGLRTLATLGKERFGAESLERPALVRTPEGWRLYVSCATPGSKHWRVDLLEAATPEQLAAARPSTVFAGAREVGLKDPVVRALGAGWQAWICCHPLDLPGEEDRMSTAYATSLDGLRWSWQGTVLGGRPGAWDARGARVTSPLPDGRLAYDGRATKEENFSERTGIAVPAGPGAGLRAAGDGPVAAVRYLDVVPAPGGGSVWLYERPRADGSHELCLERAPK
jgi:hypothetical protein